MASNIKERFHRLKDEWKAAKDEETRKQVNELIQALYDEAPEEFERIFYEGFMETVERVRTYRVQDALEPIAPMINMGYVTEHYFHRSRGWFSQRINGAIVNGKPATFTKEEIDILADALRDISKKLEDVANTIHS